MKESTSTFDMPLTETQAAIEKAISNLPDGRSKNCCRNAFRRIKQAWHLRQIDAEMAVFSAMTAEEEAASSVMAALRVRKYVNVEFLNSWSHPHKAGLIHMAHAVGRLMHECGLEDIKILVKPEIPRIETCIANLEKYGGPKELFAILDEPLNWSISLSKKEENVEGNSLVDFKRQLQDIANDKNIESFNLFIRKKANDRNTVLYAGEDGIPKVEVQDSYFQTTLRDITILVGITIAILQSNTHQLFAQQALDAYIQALGKLVKHGSIPS